MTELDTEKPIIVFARGAGASLQSLVRTGANVLSLDWTVDLAHAMRELPRDVAVQGNLDPILLNTTPLIVAHETRRLLEDTRGRAGHIVNLGHGILPQAKLENVAALVETVASFR